jgi:hypothetical protein
MNLEDLGKHILFVEGAGQALSADGDLRGPTSITPKRIAAYDQLLASAWRPDRRIVRRLLRDDKGVPAAQLDLMTDLIMGQAMADEAAVASEAPYAETHSTGEVEIEVDDEVSRCLHENQRAGETISDTIMRLLREREGDRQ